MDVTPEYLYHYTSIETLALILQNRTIRFNSLDKMDDLQEQLTADARDLGKCVFISSWTADSQESIPMWNMYASLKNGVRIRMKTNPFALRQCNPEDVIKAFPHTSIEINGMPPPALVPLSEMLVKGFYVAINDPAKILHKVEYSNDPNKLYPSVVNQDQGKTHIAFSKLGQTKNTHWEFQKEWRYIIPCIKMNYQQSIEKMIEAISSTASSIINGEYQQPFSYYDMPISDDAFNSMAVTISPQLSAGNKVIVQSLLEKFNPSAELSESELVGLI